MLFLLMQTSFFLWHFCYNAQCKKNCCFLWKLNILRWIDVSLVSGIFIWKSYNMLLTFSKLNELSLDECFFIFAERLRSDFPRQFVENVLADLIEDARKQIPQNLPVEQRLDKLLHLFYHEWGFQCCSGTYLLSEAIWLDYVLKTRRGTASILAFLLIKFADALNIPVKPVIFLSQFLIKIEWFSDDDWGINPQTGERLSWNILNRWIKGYLGITAKLNEKSFVFVDNALLLFRIIGALKTAYLHENKPEQALKVSEIMLELTPDDPYEIRDRGLIYAQLHCDKAAVSDLCYFIEKCPEDPGIELIKLHVDSINIGHTVLH